MEVLATLTGLPWSGFLESPFFWLLLLVCVPALFYYRGLPYATAINIALYIASFVIFNAFRFVPKDGTPETELLRKAIYMNSALFVTAAFAFCVYLVIRHVRRGGKLYLIDELVWIVLPFAELVQWMEHTGCKLALDPYFGREWERNEETACAAALGNGADYIAPIITTLLLLWLLYRAWRVHRGRKHEQ